VHSAKAAHEIWLSTILFEMSLAILLTTCCLILMKFEQVKEGATALTSRDPHTEKATLLTRQTLFATHLDLFLSQFTARQDRSCDTFILNPRNTLASCVCSVATQRCWLRACGMRPSVISVYLWLQSPTLKNFSERWVYSVVRLSGPV